MTCDRREFVKASTFLGAAAVVPGTLAGSFAARLDPPAKGATMTLTFRPYTAELKLDGKAAEIVGSEATREIGFLGPGETREVRWKVKVLDAAKFSAEVAIRSTRGGTDRRSVVLPEARPAPGR